MADEPRPAEPVPRTPASPSKAALGAAAFALLSGIVSFAVVRARTVARNEQRRALATAEARVQKVDADTARASAALASLASALGSLNAARQKVTAEEPKVIPPAPDDFPSPTACMRTFLPGVDVKDSSLGFVCSETDAWKIERDLYTHLAHRRGGRAWTALGPHALAALAMMRSGCCPSPEPVNAVLPGLWCGTIKEDLRTLGPAPTDEALRPYSRRLRCLEQRGMHFPDRFASVPEETSAHAFDDFLAVARHRSK